MMCRHIIHSETFMPQEHKMFVLNEFFDVMSWYLNEAHLGSSELGVHLSRLCAEAALLSKPLQMKHVYSTTKHSHAAIRKCVATLKAKGFVSSHQSLSDRRARSLLLTENFADLYETHVGMVCQMAQRVVSLQAI